jgi:hypothetical protein
MFVDKKRKTWKKFFRFKRNEIFGLWEELFPAFLQFGEKKFRRGSNFNPQEAK